VKIFAIVTVILDIFKIHGGQKDFKGKSHRKKDISSITIAKNKQKIVKNMQNGISCFFWL
jgi:hypothetical protein